MTPKGNPFMTEDNMLERLGPLDDVRAQWVTARNDSGYSRAATWAIKFGPALMDEVERLRQAILEGK